MPLATLLAEGFVAERAVVGAGGGVPLATLLLGGCVRRSAAGWSTFPITGDALLPLSAVDVCDAGSGVIASSAARTVGSLTACCCRRSPSATGSGTGCSAFTGGTVAGGMTCVCPSPNGLRCITSSTVGAADLPTGVSVTTDGSPFAACSRCSVKSGLSFCTVATALARVSGRMRPSVMDSSSIRWSWSG